MSAWSGWYCTGPDRRRCCQSGIDRHSSLSTANVRKYTWTISHTKTREGGRKNKSTYLFYTASRDRNECTVLMHDTSDVERTLYYNKFRMSIGRITGPEYRIKYIRTGKVHFAQVFQQISALGRFHCVAEARFAVAHCAMHITAIAGPHSKQTRKVRTLKIPHIRYMYS